MSLARLLETFVWTLTILAMEDLLHHTTNRDHFGRCLESISLVVMMKKIVLHTPAWMRALLLVGEDLGFLAEVIADVVIKAP